MNAYLTFKALHLIAVISWMAGLLYLPRIFVYHAETIENRAQSETFKLMEKRLYFYIMKKKHHCASRDFHLYNCLLAFSSLYLSSIKFS